MQLLPILLMLILAACNSGGSLDSSIATLKSANDSVVRIYQKDYQLSKSEIEEVTAQFEVAKKALGSMREPTAEDNYDYRQGYKDIQAAVSYYFGTYLAREDGARYQHMFLYALELLQKGIFHLEESKK